MFSFLLGCVIIALKAVIGSALISLFIYSVGIIVGLIGIAIGVMLEKFGNS